MRKDIEKKRGKTYLKTFFPYVRTQKNPFFKNFKS